MPGLSLITGAIVRRKMVSPRSDGSIQFQASGRLDDADGERGA